MSCRCFCGVALFVRISLSWSSYHHIGIILASMAIHIISFTYPNTAFGSSTIACYVLNLTVVLSFANIFNTVQHLIIWISSVIPSMMFVIWYGNTMEFVVSNLVSMVMGLTVTLVIGGYSQRCTKRSWNSISLASERLLGDRRKVSRRLTSCYSLDCFIVGGAVAWRRPHGLATSSCIQMA